MNIFRLKLYVFYGKGDANLSGCSSISCVWLFKLQNFIEISAPCKESTTQEDNSYIVGYCMLSGTPWKLERFFLWHSISQLVVKIIAQNKNWGVRCNHTKAPWKVQSWCPLSSIQKVVLNIFFHPKLWIFKKGLISI